MNWGLQFDPMDAYEAGTKASKQANMDEFLSMVQKSDSEATSPTCCSSSI